MSVITPNEILEKEFKKKLNGYDPNEVKEFLELVASYLSSVIKENNLLKRRVVSQKAQIEAYAKKENELMNALITAQRFSDDLKSQAEKEAELIIQRAKLEAESIIEDAKKESERIITQTNQQINLLNQKITDLKRIRQEMILKLKSTVDYFSKIISMEETLSIDDLIDLEAPKEDTSPSNEVTISKGHQDEFNKEDKSEKKPDELIPPLDSQPPKEQVTKSIDYKNELAEEIAEALSQEEQDDFVFASEKTIDDLKDEEILDWFVEDESNDNKDK